MIQIYITHILSSPFNLTCFKNTISILIDAIHVETQFMQTEYVRKAAFLVQLSHREITIVRWKKQKQTSRTKTFQMCQICELKSRQLQEPHKNTNQVIRTRSLKKEISLFYVIQDYNSLHTKQKKNTNDISWQTNCCIFC